MGENRVGHLFNRHGEIDAVLVIEIDAVGPEALQRFLDDPPDALRPAVQSIRAVDLEAELGGDDNVVAHGRERLADEFLVDVRAVDFCGIEERDASLVGVANDSDALGPVHTRTVVTAAEAHVAEAKLRHLQTSQFPSSHCVCLLSDALC